MLNYQRVFHGKIALVSDEDPRRSRSITCSSPLASDCADKALPVNSRETQETDQPRVEEMWMTQKYIDDIYIYVCVPLCRVKDLGNLALVGWFMDL